MRLFADDSRKRQAIDINRALVRERSSRFAAVGRYLDQTAVQIFRRTFARGRAAGLGTKELRAKVAAVGVALGAEGWGKATLARASFESVVMGTYQPTRQRAIASKDLILPALPYSRYWTVGDEKVRPEHALLHGLTAATTWSGWGYFQPPNGWNCRCWLTGVSFAEVRRNGWLRDLPRRGDIDQVDKYLAGGGTDPEFPKAMFLALGG